MVAQELLKPIYREVIYNHTKVADKVNECFQECYLRVLELEAKGKKFRKEMLIGYWYLTTRNYFYNQKQSVYIDVDTIIDEEDAQLDERKIRLIENDLQRADTENERYCKFIVQKWIEHGSIYETSKQTQLHKEVIKKSINDYINNTGLRKSRPYNDLGDSVGSEI